MDIVEVFVEVLIRFLLATENIIDTMTIVSDNVLRVLGYCVKLTTCLVIDFFFGMIVGIMYLYSSALFIAQTITMVIMLLLIRFVNGLLRWVSGGRYRPLAIFNVGNDYTSILIYVEVIRFFARLMHIINCSINPHQPWAEELIRHANEEYAGAYHQAQNFHVPANDRRPQLG